VNGHWSQSMGISVLNTDCCRDYDIEQKIVDPTH